MSSKYDWRGVCSQEEDWSTLIGHLPLRSKVHYADVPTGSSKIILLQMRFKKMFSGIWKSLMR